MRIAQMADNFIAGRPRKGCDMEVVNILTGSMQHKKTLLYYGGHTIATISDHTDNSFTLTLHPTDTHYGKIAHCNRLSAVFNTFGTNWSDRRYTAFQRWNEVRVYDRKLRTEFALHKDMMFTIKDNVISLDYLVLEQTCLSGEKPTLVIVNDTLTNSNEAINNLMALVANI